MNFADRMSRLGTESAFEVLARARALERQGKEIIHLEIGEPDFDTPVHIREAGKRALDDGATHYGPAAGLPELREAIAKDVAATRNIPVTPEEIVVTPGAKPIMYFVITALVNPGDEVIYPNPGFPIYESVINFVGGVPVPIPLREESGFGFDLDLLEKKASAKTKLIVINSPQNPTGGVLEVDQLGRIAEIARRYRIPVLTDEIYKSFLYDGEFASITRFPGLEDLIIILDGFSKAYAMTGWRLGYGVMPTAAGGSRDPADGELELLHRRLHPARRHRGASGGPDARRADGGRVQAAARPRGHGPEPAARRHLPLAARRLLRLPQCQGAEAAVEPRWRRRCSQEAGVATLGGTAFGEHGEGYLRLSYANSEANLRKALDRMRPVLARLAGAADARGCPHITDAHRCPARRRGAPPRRGGSSLRRARRRLESRGDRGGARAGPALRPLPPGVGGVHHGRRHRRADRPAGRGALHARSGRHRQRHRPGPCAARPLADDLPERSPSGIHARLRHASGARSRRASRARRQGEPDAGRGIGERTGWRTRCSSRSRSRAGPCISTCRPTSPTSRRCRLRAEPVAAGAAVP